MSDNAILCSSMAPWMSLQINLSYKAEGMNLFQYRSIQYRVHLFPTVVTFFKLDYLEKAWCYSSDNKSCNCRSTGLLEICH